MHVFLIAAITADGFIARDSQHVSTSWTSDADKKFFSERTKKAGVIVMGGKTFQTVGRALPWRLTVVYTRTPGPAIDNVRYTHEEPHKLLEQLAAEGFTEVAICGGSSIYTQFLKAGLIDRIYLTVEPVLFGTGVKLFSEELDIHLQLVEAKKIDEHTLLLEYTV